jgi:adenylate cyclase
MRPLHRLLGELRRRRVFRVAAVYGVVGWGVVEVSVSTFPALNLPGWMATAVIVLVGLGFPLAVALAWAFDLGPGGVSRTPPSPGAPAPAPPPPVPAETGRVAVPGRLRLPKLLRSPSPPASAGPRPPEAAPPPPAPADPERVRRASIAHLRHELRTPLNAVLGYSDMLIEDAEASDRPAWAAVFRGLHASGEDLLARVNETLDASAVAATGEAASVEALHAGLGERLSHPIQALIADVQRALERASGPSDADFAPDLQRIQTAATRLLGLASEIAAFSRGGGAEVPEEGASYARARVLAERVMSRIRPLAGEGADAAPLRHGHLLVVDDSPMNRDLLGRQLARQGFKVTTAAEGREALERMRGDDYDVVLLDVMMPEMDGIEVLDAMQRDRRLAEIPVIMISALDEIDSVVRCIEKGAVDYLAKPFDATLLRARIGATLELRRLREARQRAASELAAEREFRTQLLREVLPATLAERMERGEESAAEAYPEVSVLVVEIDGLGTLAARSGTAHLLERLDRIRAAFSRIGAAYPVQSLWVGDRTFVAAAGTQAGEEHHARTAAALALHLARDLVAEIGLGGAPLRVGFGIHTGPACCGMRITERLVFGIWGEAVDVAQALARRGADGEIHLSPATAVLLEGSFALQSRGVVQVSESSQLRVFRLAGSATPVAASG